MSPSFDSEYCIVDAAAWCVAGPGKVTSSELILVALTPYQGPVLSGSVEIAVAAGPEPSTWAMLLISFSALGFAAYRARTKATVGAPA